MEKHGDIQDLFLEIVSRRLRYGCLIIGLADMELSSNTVRDGSERTGTSQIHEAREETTLTLALPTSQALRALVGLKLAELGLASGQDRLLTALSERGSLSVSGLADELNVRPSTVPR